MMKRELTITYNCKLYIPFSIYINLLYSQFMLFYFNFIRFFLLYDAFTTPRVFLYLKDYFNGIKEYSYCFATWVCLRTCIQQYVDTINLHTYIPRSYFKIVTEIELIINKNVI